MHKKTLQMMATTFQEVDENSGVEKILICRCCNTLCPVQEYNQETNNCIFCKKKNEQFENLKVFTFKPVVYFFHKIGINKNEIETIEYDQMVHGSKTDFLEYNTNNMVWYIYRNVDQNILYTKVYEIFDLYKNINFSSKWCVKNSIEKFKHMFLKKLPYISIQMILSDVISSEMEFSIFLPRDRIFI